MIGLPVRRQYLQYRKDSHFALTWDAYEQTLHYMCTANRARLGRQSCHGEGRVLPQHFVAAGFRKIRWAGRLGKGQAGECARPSRIYLLVCLMLNLVMMKPMISQSYGFRSIICVDKSCNMEYIVHGYRPCDECCSVMGCGRVVTKDQFCGVVVSCA